MIGKRVQFDDETWAAVNMLRQERRRSFQQLADEAFRDLLEKYHRPADLKTQLKESAGLAGEAAQGERLSRIAARGARPSYSSVAAEIAPMKATLAVLTAAALITALPAAAQSHRPRHHAPAYEEARSVYAPPQRVCMPLCSMDTSPCDPPEFKHADGRCDYPMIGR